MVNANNNLGLLGPALALQMGVSVLMFQRANYERQGELRCLNLYHQIQKAKESCYDAVSTLGDTLKCRDISLQPFTDCWENKPYQLIMPIAMIASFAVFTFFVFKTRQRQQQ